MKRLFLALLAVGTLAACKNDKPSKDVVEASIQEAKSINPNELIDNYIPDDTINVAQMSFEQERFDFGVIDEGEVVKHTYSFTNTGKVPLVISNARSTCGCTVPVWPKEPVAVGESATIEVSFNTKGKRNKQSKPVTITANTWPAQTVVHLSGNVNPVDLKPSKPAS